MIPIINNAIDLLWLALGLISVIVLVAMLFPWGFLYEVVVLTLVVIWIGIGYCLHELFTAVKKRVRKKTQCGEVDDHNLFI